MLSLNTNINAMVAANAYSSATTAYAQASTRISTQLAINSAKDNPVGLAVANRWKAQIASYAKATDNINAGISAVQIADSALSEIATILTSMKTLATSSASGTASADVDPPSEESAKGLPVPSAEGTADENFKVVVFPALIPV